MLERKYYVTDGKNQAPVRPGKLRSGKRIEYCSCCVRNFPVDSGYCALVSVWYNWVEITERKIFREKEASMYCISYGYTFDENGKNILKKNVFKTLEQAENFANKIYDETKEIVCIEKI